MGKGRTTGCWRAQCGGWRVSGYSQGWDGSGGGTSRWGLGGQTGQVRQDTVAKAGVRSGPWGRRLAPGSGGRLCSVWLAVRPTRFPSRPRTGCPFPACHRGVSFECPFVCVGLAASSHTPSPVWPLRGMASPCPLGVRDSHFRKGCPSSPPRPPPLGQAGLNGPLLLRVGTC